MYCLHMLQTALCISARTVPLQATSRWNYGEISPVIQVETSLFLQGKMCSFWFPFTHLKMYRALISKHLLCQYLKLYK